MTKVEKLSVLIKEKFDIDVNPNSFQRVYSGYLQRSQGAFSWFMKRNDSNTDIGSCYSVTEILKNKNKLSLYNGEYWEILIENNE